MKIDLITLSGMTATDGSYVASGATVKIKFETSMENTQIVFHLRIYRSSEFYESGYTGIRVMDLPEFIILEPSIGEFYELTMLKIYEMMRDELNAHYEKYYFEIEITEDS